MEPQMTSDPTYENLLVDLEGPVATITLNRPEKLNALSPGLLRDLEQCLRHLNPGDQVRVIRIRGAGRAFCPGYDLDPGQASRREERNYTSDSTGTQLADLGESRIAVDREGLRQIVDRWLWIWNYRKPIVAQTHNYCLSGGLDLINATDIVFAAEGTRFGHPAARGLGIPLTIGMLAQKIGPSAIKELLFTGDLIDAQTAQRLRLVDHIVAKDELDERVMALCQRIAMLPLDTLSAHKHVTNRAAELAGIRTAAYEGAEYDAIHHATTASEEFARRSRTEGLRAALSWRDGPFASGPAADHDAARFSAQ
jgi:enoyl-CoA hydratase